MNLLASSPNLGLSGANVLLAKLLQGFVSHGHKVHWLVTSHEGKAEGEWLDEIGLGFQALPVTPVRAVRRRQEMLLETLSQMAPCVYFPNYDFDMLWAVGAFPANCRTVFIVHSDDPVYYDAIEQRGRVLDAIICVSFYLASEIKRRWPALADRVHHIPFGVDLPNEVGIAKPSLRDGPLEVVYCGRLAEEQKRINDLAEVILECRVRDLPVRFQIAGSGPDEDSFFARLDAPIKERRVLRLGKLPHDKVSALLGRCHVFVLTSAYEGLPVSLLEAMAHGCVPVVTAVDSGIPEVINEGINGFMLPIGDTKGFTRRLMELVEDEPVLKECGRLARASIVLHEYTLGKCVDRYLQLCSNTLRAARVAQSERQSPRTVLPPRYRWSSRLRTRLGW
jgi:glycosyltransferase involved in cell wall biosynthesis